METLRLHITYDKLILKDLVDVLSIVDSTVDSKKKELAIDKYELNKGENATVVTNVEKGSLIVDIICAILAESMPVTIGSIISNIKRKKEKAEIRETQIDNSTNTYILNININNDDLADLDAMLKSMGAGWFVSYCYYDHINSKHDNWERVGHSNRVSTYNTTRKYHRVLLSKVLDMNDNRLNRNQINLSATDIKRMAQKLLNRSDI